RGGLRALPLHLGRGSRAARAGGSGGGAPYVDRAGEDRRLAGNGGRGGIAPANLCSGQPGRGLSADGPAGSRPPPRVDGAALQLARSPRDRRSIVTIETLAATLPQGAERAPRTFAVEESVAVRIEGLRKRFPVQRSWKQLLRHPFRREWHEVLRSVSLEVRRGEVFGLLGPNGAGKTTLFKTLSTLVTPDAGGSDVAGFDLVSAA